MMARRKTKEEKAEFKSTSEFWSALLLPEEYRPDYELYRGQHYMLRVDTNSPYKCPNCPEMTLVFLQGHVVPQSEYAVWCTKCNKSIRIEHEILWPFLQPTHEHELGNKPKVVEQPAEAIEEDFIEDASD